MALFTTTIDFPIPMHTTHVLFLSPLCHLSHPRSKQIADTVAMQAQWPSSFGKGIPWAPWTWAPRTWATAGETPGYPPQWGIDARDSYDRSRSSVSFPPFLFLSHKEETVEPGTTQRAPPVGSCPPLVSCYTCILQVRSPPLHILQAAFSWLMPQIENGGADREG